MSSKTSQKIHFEPSPTPRHGKRHWCIQVYSLRASRRCLQWGKHRPSRGSGAGEPGTAPRFALLGVGLFQEGAPELVSLGGLGKDQLVVVGG